MGQDDPCGSGRGVFEVSGVESEVLDDWDRASGPPGPPARPLPGQDKSKNTRALIGSPFFVRTFLLLMLL